MFLAILGSHFSGYFAYKYGSRQHFMTSIFVGNVTKNHFKLWKRIQKLHKLNFEQTSFTVVFLHKKNDIFFGGEPNFLQSFSKFVTHTIEFNKCNIFDCNVINIQQYITIQYIKSKFLSRGLYKFLMMYFIVIWYLKTDIIVTFVCLQL